MLKQIKLNKTDSDLIQLCEDKSVDRKAIPNLLHVSKENNLLKSLVLKGEFELVQVILLLPDVKKEVKTTNLSELVRLITTAVVSEKPHAFDTLVLLKSLGGFDNISDWYYEPDVKGNADEDLNQEFQRHLTDRLRVLRKELEWAITKKESWEFKISEGKKELERLTNMLEFDEATQRKWC